MEHIKNEKLTVSICAASDDFYRQLLRMDFKVLSQLSEFQSTFKKSTKREGLPNGTNCQIFPRHVERIVFFLFSRLRSRPSGCYRAMNQNLISIPKA